MSSLLPSKLLQCESANVYVYQPSVWVSCKRSLLLAYSRLLTGTIYGLHRHSQVKRVPPRR